MSTVSLACGFLLCNPLQIHSDPYNGSNGRHKPLLSAGFSPIF